jgi:hypothetical protein
MKQLFAGSAVSVALAVSMVCQFASAAAPPELQINVLSSRPEFVTGGDALIEIVAPNLREPHELSLTLNDSDVTGQLQQQTTKTVFRGVVRNLKAGENELFATMHAAGHPEAKLKLTNHPITGPMISGPHMKPYECRTVESGLGEALDANCSAKRKVEYFYRATDGSFKSLAGGERPADVATTKTNEGKSVPYIVRVDSGVINRSIYRIAILDDGAAKSTWKPSAAWNRKLAVSFGGGSGTQYNQGTNEVRAALNDLYLSRGFAFMISTELVNQQHSNAVLQGETLMMLKEYFIENYDVPKWTVGHGGSGGAIQQLLITQLYPGLLDGLQPTVAFPDSSLHTADCGLLQAYWRKADAAVWTDAKKQAVEGYTKGTCAAWERSFVPVLTATNVKGCALKDVSKVYDPVKNPKGARCTIQEMRVNIYGRDPQTGFARRPQDNIGIQYGLAGLNSGAISVDEFLDLNERIGGNDIDGGFVSERTVGDPLALRALYESGLMNSGGGGLANVPILNSRAYTDSIGDIHDRHRDFTIRARLEKANGRADNHVIWVGPPRDRARAQATEQAGRVDLAATSLETMNTWLDAIAADSAPASTDKVVRHKPKDAVDGCWDAQGNKIVERATFDGKGKCNTLYPVHSEPRLVAGAPLTNDVVKCQLKRIDVAAYKVSFTDAQKQRLHQIYPDGVCDYSKPGVGQVGLKGTYQKY